MSLLLAVAVLALTVPATEALSTPAAMPPAVSAEAAVSVSRSSHPDGASTVVLARLEDYPDALASAPLAGALDAPILFTTSQALPTSTTSEIKRLAPRTVVVLGGSSAVSAAVETHLRNLGVGRIRRLGGADRFQTARLLAEAVTAETGSRHAYLAAAGPSEHSAGWPDAVAVSGLAAAHGRPILLSGHGDLPGPTRAVLRSMDTVTLVGGTAALSRQVQEEVDRLVPRVDRLAGPDRYATSVGIAARSVAEGASPSRLWLAAGDGFSNALAAGPAAARSGGVLLLVDARPWPDQPAGRWFTAQGTSVERMVTVGSPAGLPSRLPTPPDIDRADTGRSGLHFTPEEVAIWRLRAQQGPYRKAGDVAENSPGDWERIRSNASSFLADPTAGRWTGPSQGNSTTCVQKRDDTPPSANALRDAAFVSLIEGDARLAGAVKDELLWQARQPGTDFADRQRWCPGVMIDVSPSFPIANWMTKLLFAYDYLGRARFAPKERRLIEGWFADAAAFLQIDLDTSLSSSFVDRTAGDYRLADRHLDHPSCDRVSFLGSLPNCSLHRYYNNRRAEIARYIGLVGVHQDIASLRRSARLFVEEFLAFSVFPGGYVGEFERFSEHNPELGWAYGTQTVGAAITIADAFARSGDPRLYDHVTSEGALGTVGGDKDLLFAARLFGRYLDGTYQRYGTDEAARAGDPDYLIDGQHAPAGWYGVHDVILAPANLYYTDSYLRDMYTRTGPGMPPYPDRPATGGPNPIWAGEGGVYPGVLFMFGGMEGRVTPY